MRKLPGAVTPLLFQASSLKNLTDSVSSVSYSSYFMSDSDSVSVSYLFAINKMDSNFECAPEAAQSTKRMLPDPGLAHSDRHSSPPVPVEALHVVF